MQMKWWLGICCMVGAMSGLAVWWLALSILEGGPFGLTMLIIATPTAVLLMLAGYAVLDERERLQAISIGIAASFLASVVTWFWYLLYGLSKVKW